MKLVKITDRDGCTRGPTNWLPIGTRPPRLNGNILCQAGIYHAYLSPEIAALMDPIHSDHLAKGGLAW
jgi:hypothetical protein